VFHEANSPVSMSASAMMRRLRLAFMSPNSLIVPFVRNGGFPSTCWPGEPWGPKAYQYL
jgi:hypothetical protein